MASAIDPTKPEFGNATTQSVRDNFAAAKAEIEALQAAVPNVSSGTWTPTVTPVVNVESVTPQPGYWSRIGDVVTFGVGLQIDPVSTGDLQVLISPPVPSAFTSFFQASGAGTQWQGVTFRVSADSSTGMLTLRTNATFTSLQSFTIVGVYLVV